MERNEWLAWRKLGVCASDAPILYGKSKWRTIEELFADKTNPEIVDTPTTFIQKKGVDLEPILRNRFAAIWNLNDNENPFSETFDPALYVHPEHDFIRASLDGISSDKQTIIEIKYVGKAVLDSGIIPPAYWMQIQHQLLASGATSAYCVMGNEHNGSDMKSIPVERDESFINSHLLLCEQFWANVQARRPVESQIAIVVDEHAVQAAKEYREKVSLLKSLEQEIEEKRKFLLQYALKDETRIQDITIKRVVTKGSLDTERLSQVINLEEYRKEAKTSYRITLEEKHQ